MPKRKVESGESSSQYSYRSTPEREDELNRYQRMWDQMPRSSHVLLPPPALTWFWMKYHQEDELEQEFGLPLPRFNWVITDGSDGRVEVKDISTHIEALSKALEYWKAMGHQVKGGIHALRSDGKRFD